MFTKMNNFLKEAHMTPFSRIMVLVIPVVAAVIINFTLHPMVNDNPSFISSLVIVGTFACFYTLFFSVMWLIEIIIYSLYCWIFEKENAYAEISAYSKKRQTITYRLFILPLVCLFLFLFGKYKKSNVKAKELLVNGQ